MCFQLRMPEANGDRHHPGGDSYRPMGVFRGSISSFCRSKPSCRTNKAVVLFGGARRDFGDDVDDDDDDVDDDDDDG